MMHTQCIVPSNVTRYSKKHVSMLQQELSTVLIILFSETLLTKRAILSDALQAYMYMYMYLIALQCW